MERKTFRAEDCESYGLLARFSGCCLGTPLFKKVLQQAQAIRRQHAFHHFQTVIEEVIVGEAKLAPNSAEAQIPGAKNETLDPCVNQRSRTHDARLERGIESGLLQPVSVFRVGCLAQGDDLGMRRGVTRGDGGIEAAAKDAAVAHQNGADRYFTGELGLLRQRQGLAHELFVGGVKLSHAEPLAPDLQE